jgi:hypothetical protein
MIFTKFRCSYGHRSILLELSKQGLVHGRKLMAEQCLRPTASLPKPYGKGNAGERWGPRIDLIGSSR